jgi:lipoprotein-anchoring transpeptidase ErfK/SrfK
MRSLFVLSLIAALWASGALAQTNGRYSIEIDLQEQMAHLVEDGYVVLSSPISSGRAGYETTRGMFKITQKERAHVSNLYGRIVDARGRTLVANAHVDMPVPRGGRYVPASMPYFLRYNGAEGMHAGILPGYPASHGCVRLPQANAIAFFNAVETGTPVNVFGTTPRGRVRQRDYLGDRQQQQRRMPRIDRRQVINPYAPDWWR